MERGLTRSDRIRRIVRYYDESHIDYVVVWSNRDNLAQHFGYWENGTRWHGESLKNMNRLLADQVSIGPQDLVLDAGCGYGGSAIWLARHRGARAVGVNLNEKQIRLARRFARRHGVESRVRFLLGDYSIPAFRDGSFDVVWGLESVCHAPDKGEFASQAWRLLRPGGRLVVGDGFARLNSVPAAAREDLRRFLDGWAITDLAEVEGFTRDLEAAGFEGIRFRDVTAEVHRSTRRLYRIARWLEPGARMMGRVGARSPVGMGNLEAALLQYSAFREAAWIYGVFTAQRPWRGPTPPAETSFHRARIS